MAHFKIRNLSGWWPVEGSFIIPGVAGVAQRVRLFFNCRDADAAIYLNDEGGREILVAVGAGQHRVDATVVGASVVRLDGDGEVFLRAVFEPQVVEHCGTPSFTSLEPKGSGIHSEVHRMMHLQRLNALHREGLLRQELEAMGAGYRELRQKLAERNKAAVPADEPVTE